MSKTLVNPLGAIGPTSDTPAKFESLIERFNVGRSPGVILQFYFCVKAYFGKQGNRDTNSGVNHNVGIVFKIPNSNLI